MTSSGPTGSGRPAGGCAGSIRGRGRWPGWRPAGTGPPAVVDGLAVVDPTGLEPHRLDHILGTIVSAEDALHPAQQCRPLTDQQFGKGGGIGGHARNRDDRRKAPRMLSVNESVTFASVDAAGQPVIEALRRAGQRIMQRITAPAPHGSPQPGCQAPAAAAQPGRLPGYDRTVVPRDGQVTGGKCPQALMHRAAHRVHRTAQAQRPDVAVPPSQKVSPQIASNPCCRRPSEAVPVGFLVRIVDQVHVGKAWAAGAISSAEQASDRADGFMRELIGQVPACAPRRHRSTSRLRVGALPRALLQRPQGIKWGLSVYIPTWSTPWVWNSSRPARTRRKKSTSSSRSRRTRAGEVRSGQGNRRDLRRPHPVHPDALPLQLRRAEHPVRRRRSGRRAGGAAAAAGAGFGRALPSGRRAEDER